MGHSYPYLLCVGVSFLVLAAAAGKSGSDETFRSVTTRRSLDAPDINAFFSIRVKDDSYKMSLTLTHNAALEVDPSLCLNLPPPFPTKYIVMAPKEVQKAAGVYYAMVDWNPCGHPGPQWLIAHWDVHFFTTKTPYTDINCGGTEIPVCTPDNPAAAPFYVAPTRDIPAHYIQDDVAINFMGMHYYDPAANGRSVTAAEWEIPDIIFGGIGAKRSAFYEIMIPLKTFQTRKFRGKIAYGGTKSSTYYPDSWKLVSDEKSMRTKVTFTGPLKEKKSKKKKGKSKANKKH